MLHHHRGSVRPLVHHGRLRQAVRRGDGRAVYLRYVEHEDDARDPNTTKAIGLHFQLPGHSIKDMQMIPVEKVRGGIAVRKIRELAMIRKHKLASHLGLNTQA